MSIFSGVCAYHQSNFSAKTYNGWCKKCGGIGRSLLSEMGSLQKDNDRLENTVAEIELDKLIWKER